MIWRLPRPEVKRPPRAARDLSGLVFVTPYFLLFVAFGLFGLLFSLYVSFHNWDPIAGDGAMRFRGLRLYALALTDPPFWAALARSLADGLPVVVVQHLIAIPLAFSLHVLYRRAIGTLGVVYFLPYIVSPVAFSAAIGLLYSLLSAPLGDLLGFLRYSLDWHFLPRGLQSYSAFEGFQRVWSAIGWNILLYLMALQAVPRSLLEAAGLDGAGFWRQLTRVAVPIIRPMIFVAFSMSLVQGLQANVWRAEYRSENLKLPAYIYGTAFNYTNFGLASAQTWIFFAVMLLFILAAYGLFGRNFTAIETPANLESDSSPVLLSKVSTVLVKVCVTLAALFSIYPVVLLLFQSTQSGGQDSYMLQLGSDFNINYGVLTDRIPEFWRNLWNSLYVSVLASLGAMTTSALAGFAFATLEFRFKRPLFFLVMGAMVFPAMSNAIPYLTEMRVLDWIDTPRALWVPAMVSAVGVFLVRQYTLNTVPRPMLEAARIDGASEALIFTRIALPQMLPVLWTVGLLTFITTWNHLEVALFLMRSEATRLLPQALALIGDGGGDAATVGAAIGTIPPLLIYGLAAGQLGRGLGLAGAQAGAWWRGLNFWKRPVTAPASLAHLAVLDGADGIRAIACLAVVFSHLAQRLEMPRQVPLVQEIQSFLMSGGFGVSAFFVLSGMLLSMPFWRRYLDGGDPPDLKQYARRRFLRIAPGFYASLIAVFLISRALEPGDEAYLRLLSGLSFTTAFHYVTFFPTELNGPLWSIGFEVFCYALMPVLMLGLFALLRFLGRRGATRVTSRVVNRSETRQTARGEVRIQTTVRTVTRHFAPVKLKAGRARAEATPGSAALAFAYWGAALLLTILAHGWIVTHLVPDSDGRGWDHGLIGGAKFWMPNYNPVGLFAQYSIGVLTAGFIAYRQRRLRLGQTGLPARHRRFDAVVIAAFVGAVLLVWNLRHANEFSFSLGSQPYAFPTFAILIGLILYAAPFAVRAQKILDNPFARYTARLSFGLYIWHYPILELVRLLHNGDFRYFGISSLGHWFTLSAVILALAYWVASLSYRHIELPFLSEPGRAKPSQPAAREGAGSVIAPTA